MMQDIVTLIQKEWKEVVFRREAGRQSWISLVILIGLVGIYLPYMNGAGWLQDPTALFTWVWVPLFMTNGMIADAFAGERERHTLETLLATRLSDTAILLGKIAASVLYAWITSLVCALVGAITVNVMFPTGGLQFYNTGMFFGGIAAVLLIAILISGIGVFVSLKASTVRQAYQKLSLSIMAIWFIPFILLQSFPDEMQNFLVKVAPMLDQNLSLILAGVFGLLVVADAIMLLLAKKRFKRTRLILE
ncbi:MAG: ABC transporter permease subunit [Chloroflexi bacterium]|jgi:ABC-2 type transport system permease protein|nr:ABC transporter permease subunit [Chloroflexota bacterium]